MTDASSQIFYRLFKQKVVTRIIASITLVIFVFGLFSYDIEAAQSPDRQDLADPAVKTPFTISIPHELGSIVVRSSPDAPSADPFSGPIVVHIQDAHCNYGAQLKVAAIIRYLHDAYGFSAVNLEGGRGSYDLSIFERIGDRSLRAAVAEKFLKDGRIGGAEYLAATRGGSIDLWGVEDTGLYLGNLNAYRDSLARKADADALLASIGATLASMKPRIYSKGLLAYDAAYRRYRSGSIEFREYLVLLISLAARGGIDLSGLPNAGALAQVIDREGGIDFELARRERSALIESLRGALSKRQAAQLADKAASCAAGRLSQDRLCAYLFATASRMRVDTSACVNLKRYARYLRTYGAIDPLAVMKELEALDIRVRESLVRSDAERALDGISRNHALLKSFFASTITRDEYDYYVARKGSFSARAFSETIGSLGGDRIAGLGRLDGYRARMERFYDASLRRDRAFVKNIRYSGTTVRGAILVTGGFHAKHIEDLLRREGAAYISILPNFRNPPGYISPYFDLLSGRQTGATANIRTALGFSLAVASILSEMRFDIYGPDSDILSETYAQWVAASAQGKGLDITGDGTRNGAVGRNGELQTVTHGTVSDYIPAAIDIEKVIARRNAAEAAEARAAAAAAARPKTTIAGFMRSLWAGATDRIALLRFSERARLAHAVTLVSRAPTPGDRTGRSIDLLRFLRDHPRVTLDGSDIGRLVAVLRALYYWNSDDLETGEIIAQVLTDAASRDGRLLEPLIKARGKAGSYTSLWYLSNVIVDAMTRGSEITIAPDELEELRGSVEYVATGKEDLGWLAAEGYRRWRKGFPAATRPPEAMDDALVSELKDIAIYANDLITYYIARDRNIEAIGIEADAGIAGFKAGEDALGLAEESSLLVQLLHDERFNEIAKAKNSGRSFRRLGQAKQMLYLHVIRTAVDELDRSHKLTYVLEMIRSAARYYRNLEARELAPQKANIRGLAEALEYVGVPKPAAENWIVPAVEELGMFWVLSHYGPIAYLLTRIGFVVIHWLQDRASPEVRTAYEKIAIPLVSSLAALIPLAASFFFPAEITNCLYLGLFAHIAGNGAVDIYKLNYQKGNVGSRDVINAFVDRVVAGHARRLKIDFPRPDARRSVEFAPISGRLSPREVSRREAALNILIPRQLVKQLGYILTVSGIRMIRHENGRLEVLAPKFTLEDAGDAQYVIPPSALEEAAYDVIVDRTAFEMASKIFLSRETLEEGYSQRELAAQSYMAMIGLELAHARAAVDRDRPVGNDLGAFIARMARFEAALHAIGDDPKIRPPLHNDAGMAAIQVRDLVRVLTKGETGSYYEPLVRAYIDLFRETRVYLNGGTIARPSRDDARRIAAKAGFDLADVERNSHRFFFTIWRDGGPRLTADEERTIFDYLWSVESAGMIRFPRSLRDKVLRKRFSALAWDFSRGFVKADEMHLIYASLRLARAEEEFVWRLFHATEPGLSNRRYEILIGGRGSVVKDEIERMPGQVRVLDLGCGTNGVMIKGLADAFPGKVDGYGIDIALEGSGRGTVRLTKGDARSLPYPDSYFDIVYESALLQYFKGSDDLKRIVSEVRRVLKPGGRFISMCCGTFDKALTDTMKGLLGADFGFLGYDPVVAIKEMRLHDAADRAGERTSRIGKGSAEVLPGKILSVTERDGSTRRFGLVSEGPVSTALLASWVGVARDIPPDKKSAILSFIRLLESSPPEFCTYGSPGADSVIETGVYGVASPARGLIALHARIEHDLVARFHEILEYLASPAVGRIRISVSPARLSVYDAVTGEPIYDDPISAETAKALGSEPWWAGVVSGSYPDADQQRHYAIRILQSELFGKRDEALSALIHAFIATGETVRPWPEAAERTAATRHERISTPLSNDTFVREPVNSILVWAASGRGEPKLGESVIDLWPAVTALHKKYPKSVIYVATDFPDIYLAQYFNGMVRPIPTRPFSELLADPEAGAKWQGYSPADWGSFWLDIMRDQSLFLEGFIRRKEIDLVLEIRGFSHSILFGHEWQVRNDGFRPPYLISVFAPAKAIWGADAAFMTLPREMTKPLARDRDGRAYEIAGLDEAREAVKSDGAVVDMGVWRFAIETCRMAGLDISSEAIETARPSLKERNAAITLLKEWHDRTRPGEEPFDPLKKIFVINIFGSTHRNMISSETWARIVKRLLKETDAYIVFTRGGAMDPNPEQVDVILTLAGETARSKRILAPRQELYPGITDIIGMADWVLTIDTGTSHLASGVYNRPTTILTRSKILHWLPPRPNIQPIVTDSLSNENARMLLESNFVDESLKDRLKETYYAGVVDSVLSLATEIDRSPMRQDVLVGRLSALSIINRAALDKELLAKRLAFPGAEEDLRAYLAQYLETLGIGSAIIPQIAFVDSAAQMGIERPRFTAKLYTNDPKTYLLIDRAALQQDEAGQWTVRDDVKGFDILHEILGHMFVRAYCPEFEQSYKAAIVSGQETDEVLVAKTSEEILARLMTVIAYCAMKERVPGFVNAAMEHKIATLGIDTTVFDLPIFVDAIMKRIIDIDDDLNLYKYKRALGGEETYYRIKSKVVDTSALLIRELGRRSADAARRVRRIVEASLNVIRETNYRGDTRYIFVPVSREICPGDRVRNAVQEVWQAARSRISGEGFGRVELIIYNGSAAELDEKVHALMRDGVVLSKENSLAFMNETVITADHDRYASIEAMRSAGMLTVVRERIPAEGTYISIGGHVALALGLLNIVRNGRSDDDYIDLVARLAAALSDGSPSATPEAFRALLKKGDVADIVIFLPAASAHDIDKNMEEYFLAEKAMIAA